MTTHARGRHARIDTLSTSHPAIPTVPAASRGRQRDPSRPNVHLGVKSPKGGETVAEIGKEYIHDNMVGWCR